MSENGATPDILKVPATIGLDLDKLPNTPNPKPSETIVSRRKIDLISPRTGYKRAVLDQAKQLTEQTGLSVPDVPNYYYLVEYGEDLIAESDHLLDDLRQLGVDSEKARPLAIKTAHRTASKLIAERIQGEIDPLTGLLNRRGFDRQILYMLDDAVESNEPLCVIVGDVNGLKAINDTKGHGEGDKLIRDTAVALDGRHRDTDLLTMLEARYGGDEFRLVLPRTFIEGAQAWFAETANTFERANISIGLGAVEIHPDELKGLTRDQKLLLIEQKSEEADAASYAAKDIAKKGTTIKSMLLPTDHPSAQVQILKMREARARKAPEINAQSLVSST